MNWLGQETDNEFEYLDGKGTDRLGLDLQQQGLWLGLLFRF
jgi:hypothetical protein